MINRIRGALANWLGVPELQREVENLQMKVRSTEHDFKVKCEELDRLTAIDLDVSYRGKSTIILTGEYRGRGYVKFYDVDISEFKHYVELLRHEHGKEVFRNTDVPMGFNGHFEL